MKRKRTPRILFLIIGFILILLPLLRHNAPQYDLPEVILDAGHGGYDSGAVYNGIKEKDINLEIARELQRYLEQQGIIVHMLRYTDTAFGESEHQDLKHRVQLANQMHSAFFVSIHANASPAHTGNGYEIYTNTKSQAFAEQVAKAMQKQPYIDNRGVHDGQHLYVLRNTLMQSILIETGYLDGKDDQQILNDKDRRLQLAHCIGDGIKKAIDRQKEET